MKQITLYTRHYCGWCLDAKDCLKERGLPFVEVDVGQDAAANEDMLRLSGQRYVPTLVVNGNVLANFDVEELEKFLAQLGM